MQNITCSDCGISFETLCRTKLVRRCPACRLEAKRSWARAKQKERRKSAEFRDMEKEAHRIYIHKNPDKRSKRDEQTRWQKRRAKKMGLPHSLTSKQWNNILVLFEYKCAYCDKDISQEQKHREHFIPLRLNGPLTAGNIIPSCAECNKSKAGKHPLDWMVRLDHGLVRFAKLSFYLGQYAE